MKFLKARLPKKHTLAREVLRQLELAEKSATQRRRGRTQGAKEEGA